MEDTIVVVGVTREDEYGNLWVTPKGEGEEIKIASKRSNLHPLFEQGRAVLLHWETYKGKTYVADAKTVAGELPPPVDPPKTVTPDDTTSTSVTTKAHKPDSKNRAFALSYAKDYTVAKINKGTEQNVNDVVIVAEVFLQYLEGNVTPDVAKIVSALNKK